MDPEGEEKYPSDQGVEQVATKQDIESKSGEEKSKLYIVKQ